MYNAAPLLSKSTKAPEYPNIASVYLNRYHKGERLCADPTVKFALHDQTIKRILFRHLQVDSPYNTYKHTDSYDGPTKNGMMIRLNTVEEVEQYQKAFNDFFEQVKKMM
jgi:UPF0755 protein